MLDAPAFEPFFVTHFIAHTVIGHDALDAFDAMPAEPFHGVSREDERAVAGFIGHYFAVSEAAVVIDRDMQILPASAISTRSIAMDAVADTVDTRQLFDVDMNDFAGRFALVAQWF